MSAVSPRTLLSQLVSIPSSSGSEGAIADFVSSFLAEHGVRAERLGHTLLARTGRAGGPRFLLCSHLDTVPVGEGWTRDPLSGVWSGDRLYGRGANDAKASVATMICAFLQFLGSDLPGELWLGLTECEETNNRGMAALLEHAGAPDGAVIGEPTGLDVVRAQSGLAVLKAQWSGSSCHAAHVARVEHRNALLAAVRDAASLPDYLLLSDAHPLLGKSTVVATQLASGTRHNVVPDAAEMVFDARLAPPHSAAEVAALLRERLPAAAISIRSERLRPFETPAEHPLVAAALATAGRGEASGSSTLSDMALLQGVPAIKCGPGLTARSHTPDEFVTLPELEAGAAFYSALVPRALQALAVVRAAAAKPHTSAL